jgi:hypothetical protein
MTHKSPPAGRMLLGRLSRSLGNIAISLAVILVLLAATEITLRVLNFPLLRLVSLESNAGYAHDPELGWLPRPNSVRQQTASRTVTLSHNSLGLRDIELVPTVGPTILFLGSSYVYGIEVEADERFTERLRSSLPGVRIVNAGIPGYSNDQQYVLLQRLWPRVEPNVVVLIFGPGERNLNRSNFTFDGFKPYLENIDGQWQMRGQPVPISPKSHLYDFYDNWFAHNFAIVRLGYLAYWSNADFVRSVPDPTEQLVSMARSFTQARGGKLLVGLLSRDSAMEAFLNLQDIPYVRFDEAERYPEWGHHWTPRGHALVAERLKSLLFKERVVPEAAGN